MLTREVCYYVHYVDGKEEHLSREEVDRYFYAHANASAAIWDMVDFWNKCELKSRNFVCTRQTFAC